MTTAAQWREREALLPPLRWHDTVVTGIREVTNRMVRVTLAGESIRSFASTGPDEHFKLILPRSPGPLPAFDLDGNVYQQWRALPEAVRPILRTYTVRSLRTGAGELDVDFALHGGGTPAMCWLDGLHLGDPCAIYGTRAEFEPPPDTRHVMLFADDAGTPALARTLASLPDSMRVDAVIQTCDADGVQLLEHGPLARVFWTHPVDDVVGSLAGLIGAVRALEPPGEPWYVWAAGAAEALPALRRVLRGWRGHDRDRLELVGYWRARGAIDAD